METIFRGQDVEVIAREGGGESIAVSFSNWTSVQPRPLWDKHIDGPAIFFVAKRNHWYQTREMENAFKAIEPLIARFSRKSLMGSSMGGFAAIAFAERLGATRTIAVSPQVSLELSLAPFETRWRAEAKALTEWIHRITESKVPAHVVFDPHHPIDGAHVKAIKAAHKGTFLWPLAYSGHPTGFALADLGLLDKLVHVGIDGEEEAPLFLALSEEYNQTSSQSVTVAINDFRYGLKRAADMTVDQISSLRGSQSVKQQLVDMINNARLNADDHRVSAGISRP